MQKNTNNTEPLTITASNIAEVLNEAKRKLEELSTKPYVVQIASKYPFWNLIKKDPTIRSFIFWGGIPCITDLSIPSNIARFYYSDGTIEEVEIVNKIKYLPYI